MKTVQEKRVLVYVALEKIVFGNLETECKELENACRHATDKEVSELKSEMLGWYRDLICLSLGWDADAIRCANGAIYDMHRIEQLMADAYCIRKRIWEQVYEDVSGDELHGMTEEERCELGRKIDEDDCKYRKHNLMDEVLLDMHEYGKIQLARVEENQTNCNSKEDKE